MFQEQTFTVKAKITGIDKRFGWCYMACNLCQRKVKENGGLYECEGCNREQKYHEIQ